MSIIAGTAACCVHSTLAAREETGKPTLAAPEETNKAEAARKFDWEENAANLRQLKLANSSLNRDRLESE